MVQQSLLTLLLLPVLALGAPKPNWTATSATSAPASTSSSSPSSGKGGQVFLKNSCSYEVTVDAIPGPGCSSGGSGTVSAGSTWTDTLADCSNGNTALKVYGNGSEKPMQFEYGLVGDTVWYDMSFIDCLTSTSDFSQCAGSSWSMGSVGSCPTYACKGGSECCTQGYCDPDASVIDPDPNAGCGAPQGYSTSDVGITIELCA
ncbi:hypothetical protein N0V90_010780 [Kalmusia sp. IMI 367209]|nr:hypothetical protein N0V90_010780 [Kalmusia sp. IMI 367209]